MTTTISSLRSEGYGVGVVLIIAGRGPPYVSELHGAVAESIMGRASHCRPKTRRVLPAQTRSFRMTGDLLSRNPCHQELVECIDLLPIARHPVSLPGPKHEPERQEEHDVPE